MSSFANVVALLATSPPRFPNLCSYCKVTINLMVATVSAMHLRYHPDLSESWFWPAGLSSVKVGENHVVLGYGRERPMY
jgi:hypothetical protein